MIHMGQWVTGQQLSTRGVWHFKLQTIMKFKNSQVAGNVRAAENMEMVRRG